MQRRRDVGGADRAEAGQAAADDLDEGLLACPFDCGEFGGSAI
jgi:hypothetical protein